MRISTEQFIDEHFPQTTLVDGIWNDDGKRYLLVEVSVYSSTEIWAGCFDSLEDLTSYHDSQEHPQDWPIAAVVDLETGTEYEAATEVIVTTTLTPADAP